MFTHGKIIKKFSVPTAVFGAALAVVLLALTAHAQEDNAARIGNRTWMTRNLSVETEGSWCYDNNTENCSRYGRLYTWAEAVAACANQGEGWRLPTNDEWSALVNTAGMSGVAGNKLKAKSGWGGNGNGTDDFGFAALPGGHRFTDGKFYDAGGYGYWWSADEHFGTDAYYLGLMQDSGNEAIDVLDKTSGLSVRCVRD